MSEKRICSIFVPYKTKDGAILVFLNKRANTAQRLPGYFGFFGGGREGDEDPDQTLRREVKEELNIVPDGYQFLGRYEFERSIKDVFYLGVDDDFEKGIAILEGDGGRYFNEVEVSNEQKLIEEDKTILRDLFAILHQEKHV